MENFGVLEWTMLMIAVSNSIAIGWSYAAARWLPTSATIQDRKTTLVQFYERLPLVLLNVGLLFTLSFVALSVFEGLFSWEPLAWWVVAIQVVAVAMVDDLFFYGFHRTLHENKWLYRHIHKIHHRAYAPCPMDYVYVHPLEWMGGSIGIVLGLAVVAGITGDSISAYTFLIYSGLRNIHELDIHSGLPSGRLASWVPWFGPAEHHDMHHARPNSGNYGSTFLWWDMWFGTRATESAERGTS